ncbi:MAG: rhodanese-like domain-containing protein, partial [Cyanobacteria bacterium J06600_6]
YLGHDSVALLDGGWQGWVGDNYPVSSDLAVNKPGQFLPQPNSDWLVDIETVKTAGEQDNMTIVDSRDRDRYLGLREPIDPVAGSIPGAVNSPWKQVSDKSGYLQPLAVQKALWSDLQSAAEIIIYCGSGVTACVNLFSLCLAGCDRAKLYPGGWSDWCSYLEET